MSTRHTLRSSGAGTAPVGPCRQSAERIHSSSGDLGLNWAPVTDVTLPYRTPRGEEKLVGTDSAMLALVDAANADDFYEAIQGYVEGLLVMEEPVISHAQGLLIGTRSDGAFSFEVLAQGSSVERIDIDVNTDEDDPEEIRTLEFSCPSGTMVLAAPEKLESFELEAFSAPAQSFGGWAQFALPGAGTARVSVALDASRSWLLRRIVIEYVPN